MSKSMKAELKMLNVPFFNVRPELVGLSQGVPNADGVEKSSPQKITDGQLLELQRRMLQYLEDMYKL